MHPPPPTTFCFVRHGLVCYVHKQILVLTACLKFYIVPACLPLLLPPLQSILNQMVNFAVQNRADETLLSRELAQRGLRSVKVVVVQQDLDTHIGSDTAALRQYGVEASINEVGGGRHMCVVRGVCVYVLRRRSQVTEEELFKRKSSQYAIFVYIYVCIGTVEDGKSKRKCCVLSFHQTWQHPGSTGWEHPSMT